MGPEGITLIDEFCRNAEKGVADLDAGFVKWLIMPRSPKTLPEIEYFVGEKKLNHDQADRYLRVFNKSLDEFEGHLHLRFSELITEFMQQQ